MVICPTWCLKEWYGNGNGNKTLKFTTSMKRLPDYKVTAHYIKLYQYNEKKNFNTSLFTKSKLNLFAIFTLTWQKIPLARASVYNTE